MKFGKIWLFVFVVTSYGLRAQAHFSSAVITENTGMPIPYAYVMSSLDSTSTNMEGKFTIRILPQDVLYLVAQGYEPLKIFLKSADTIPYILLKRKAYADFTQDTVGTSGLEVMREVWQNRSKNHPENYAGIGYKTYYKFKIALPPTRHDKVDVPMGDFFLGYDLFSLGENIKKWRKSLDGIFINEGVMEYSHESPLQKKRKIHQFVASGFKSHDINILTERMHEMSVYDNFMYSYLSPLSEDAVNKYDFYLDKKVMGVRDTTYIILFRPMKKNENSFNALMGSLHIDARNHQVKKVSMRSFDRQGSFFNFFFDREYTSVYGKYWIPDHTKIRLGMDYISIGNTTFVSQYESGYLSSKRIKSQGDGWLWYHYTLVEEEGRVGSEERYWSDYRATPLKFEEKKIYKDIGDFGDDWWLDSWLTAYYRDGFRIGSVDLKFQDLLQFNRYEGVRLQGSLTTNTNFSRRLFISTTGAYGLNDDQLKYKTQLLYSWLPHRKFTTKVWYGEDISPSGRYNPYISRIGSILNYASFNFGLTSYSKYSKRGLGFGYLPFPNFEFQTNFERTREKVYESPTSLFDPSNSKEPSGYFFVNDGRAINDFNFFETSFSVYYDPLSRYITSQEGWRSTWFRDPAFFFSYTVGLKHPSLGDYDYYKIDLGGLFTVEQTDYGFTSVQWLLGMTINSIPYSKLYSPRGNALSGNTILQRISLPSSFSFETVAGNEFLSDRYFSVKLRHRFLSSFLNFFFIRPRITFILSTYYGMLSNPTVHKNIQFKVPNHGIWETGIHLYDLFTFFDIKVHVGTYVRLGAYAHTKLSDNVHMRVGLSL